MALTVAEDKECDAAVKVSLTAAIGNNARATASHFHRVLRVLRGGVTLALQLLLPPRLDAASVLDHCARVNGLNHICGICREIIG
jgi:hypothetical protein